MIQFHLPTPAREIAHQRRIMVFNLDSMFYLNHKDTLSNIRNHGIYGTAPSIDGISGINEVIILMPLVSDNLQPNLSGFLDDQFSIIQLLINHHFAILLP